MFTFFYKSASFSEKFTLYPCKVYLKGVFIMSTSLGSVVSSFGKYADKGANFIFGTGSHTVGKSIRTAVRVRNYRGRSDSFVRAVANGFANGVKKDNAQLAKMGFVQKTWQTLRSIPGEMAAGFKGGKGLGKIGKFLKPLGKSLPFAMNLLWIAGSLPNIIERTKDEGILGCLKETGKTIVKMGSFALGSALGMAFGGFGGFVGGAILSGIADNLMGEGYKDKKDRLAQEAKEAQEAQAAQAGQYANNGTTSNPFSTFNTVV